MSTASSEGFAVSLAERMGELGLEIDPLVSSEMQVFASDPAGSTAAYGCRIKVFATWTDRLAGEVQFEVMSDEPMLRVGTRCELTAMALQAVFPPV